MIKDITHQENPSTSADAEVQPLLVEKKQTKLNRLLPYLAIAIFLILLTVVVYFSLQPSPSPKTIQTSEQVTTAPTQVMQEDATDTLDTKSLYLGMYKGVEVVVKRPCTMTPDQLVGYNNNENIRHITDLNDAQYIAFVSALNPEEAYHSSTPADTREISNLKKIFSSTKCNYFMAGLKGSTLPDENRNMLYVSVDEQDTDENKLLQINLSDLSSKEIWSHITGDPFSKEYDGYYGDAYLEQVVAGKYLVFSIWDCTSCSPPSLNRVFGVLNLETLSEKYLGLVGNVQIDTKNQVVTYQNLAGFTESCADCTGMCPGCDLDESGNYVKTVMKPSGETRSAPLP